MTGCDHHIRSDRLPRLTIIACWALWQSHHPAIVVPPRTPWRGGCIFSLLDAEGTVVALRRRWLPAS
ncbi:MAG: hypothetical protein ACLVJH_12045 [Faecalibacterium prausnitzii]